MRIASTRGASLAALGASLVLSAQSPSPAPSAAREFFVYGWRAPAIDGAEARIKAMADAGFTLVNAAEDEVPTVARHGVKAMVTTKDAAVAARLASNPAVWGYHLGDEPFPEAVFAGIGRQFRAFEQAAPAQVPFVNMLSTTGEFLRAYMDDARPPLLSFDYYQWWWGSDRYFEKLEQFREAAVRAGVPLAACFEVSANPGVEWGDLTRLPDNDRRLRQSVYTSLAYGVTGIEWFHSDMVFSGGALTPAGRDVAAINHEIAPLGRVLAGLRSTDVFHTPPLPAGTRSLPKEHWVQAIPEERGAGVVLGMFRDGEGRDYAMVANRDYKDAQTVVMKLQSKWLGIAPWYTPKQYKYAVDRLDRAKGTWTTVASSSSVGFSYVIPAAEAELFRVTTTVATEGSAEGWPLRPPVSPAPKLPEPMMDPSLRPLVDEAVADLAKRLSLPLSAIAVIEARAMVWPDGSFGCPQPGMMYAQVQQDGFRIRLRAQERDFAYHGGGSRRPFLCESAR